MVWYNYMTKKRTVDNRWSPDMHAIRRHRVASLLIRGLKEHEIVRALSQEAGASYTVNPKTGKPYSQKTINKDIHALREEWRDMSSEAIDGYYGDMIATALEVQRAAWARGNLDLVLEASGELRQIIGKPVKSEVAFVNLNDVDLSIAQLEALAAGATWAQVLAME